MELHSNAYASCLAVTACDDSLEDDCFDAYIAGVRDCPEAPVTAVNEVAGFFRISSGS